MKIIRPVPQYIIIVGVLTLALILSLSVGCLQQDSTPAASPAGSETLPYTGNYTPGEITGICENATETANASLAAIVAIPPDKRTFDNTFVAFDRIMTDYADATFTPSLMGYVSPDPVIAKEGMEAEETTTIFSDSVYSRKDLYEVLKSQVPRNTDEARLYNVTINEFEHNGLELPQEELDAVVGLKRNLTGLESEFSANLNSDNTTLAFTSDELAGVPASSLATFGRVANGSYLVTTKYPDYIAVMTYATNNQTRERMYAADLDVQGETNTRLLEEAIVLREEIAHKLGYTTWADYQLDGRTAKNTSNVMAFLDALKAPLIEKNKEEMAGLLNVKKELAPSAVTVDPWDVAYLENIQKQQQYDYDEEEFRAYFPADTVVPKMFEVFGTLYGVRFEEVQNAPVWSPDVRLYRVTNTTDNATVGYLYLDLYPRDGKYSSFMESTLIKGRVKDSAYPVPVVAVVANCPAPANGTPSLLTMYDMESLFHETGHAMHDIFTTAPYGTLSRTSVSWDFVETPSQTMEEWVNDPAVLESLSGRYTNASETIPPDLARRAIASRSEGLGIQYSSQLAYALEDMRFHTATGPVNVTQVWNETDYEIKGRPAVTGTHQPASFSHLMGGYDARYYGYLWSKVYALNVLDTFEHEGMTNTTTGMRFRNDVLSRGNMEDGTVLLTNFLGHEPGVEPLYTYLGIPQPQAAAKTA
jgi:thimet oligopeptidase